MLVGWCTLTSAMLFSEGAAINTTYGVNSDVRKIFNACGSTSKMAIFPSLWMRRIVSNLVPYIASSWVPVKYIHEYYYKYNGMISFSRTEQSSHKWILPVGEPFIELLPINLLIVDDSHQRKKRTKYKMREREKMETKNATYHTLNIHWLQCQPSFRHVTRNNSFDHSLHLDVVLVLYLLYIRIALRKMPPTKKSKTHW